MGVTLKWWWIIHRVIETTDKANEETDKNIGIEKYDDSDNDNEIYDNDSIQSTSSDVETSLKVMEIKPKRKNIKTVLEERIEEYILQGITEKFNPFLMKISLLVKYPITSILVKVQKSIK